MISKNDKKQRLPSKKTLKAIAEALDEITAHFELAGFFARMTEGEGSEDVGGPTVFDREDIEVAIGVFISRLSQHGILKSNEDEPTSFSGVFESFFGEDHEITEMANQFEERIEGYFDLVGSEDMDGAYNLALEMKGALLR